MQVSLPFPCCALV